MLIDLSHAIEHGMTTYPGLPAPLICDFLTREASREKYAEGTEFQIGQITLVANTGTYVDAPFHRFPDGADLAALPLDDLADLPAITIRIPRGQRPIDRHDLEAHDLRNRAVLFDTGWSRHWRTPAYLQGHPYLTAGAARYLVDQGVRMVGIDSLNIDDTDDGTRPVHTTLLGAGIPIVEHMADLTTVPDDGFRFHAVPVKIVGMGTFPVRAYAVV